MITQMFFLLLFWLFFEQGVYFVDGVSIERFVGKDPVRNGSVSLNGYQYGDECGCGISQASLVAPNSMYMDIKFHNGIYIAQYLSFEPDFGIRVYKDVQERYLGTIEGGSYARKIVKVLKKGKMELEIYYAGHLEIGFMKAVERDSKISVLTHDYHFCGRGFGSFQNCDLESFHSIRNIFFNDDQSEIFVLDSGSNQKRLSSIDIESRKLSILYESDFHLNGLCSDQKNAFLIGNFAIWKGKKGDLSHWSLFAGHATQGGFNDGKVQVSRFEYITNCVIWNNALFVADSANHVIRKVDLTTQLVTTYFGQPNKHGFTPEILNSTSLLFSPRDLLLYDDSLLVLESGNNLIRRIRDSFWKGNGIHCYGISITNTSVCTGSGICRSNNFCQCQDKRFGYDCSLPLCFGKTNVDENVCQGHGFCHSFDNCTCDDGYSGRLCNPTCFGFTSDHPSVCNHGQGDCIAPNSCSCFDQLRYFGKECKDCQSGFWKEIQPNNEVKCIDCDCFPEGSNSKACDKTGQCSCKFEIGYSGKNCRNCIDSYYKDLNGLCHHCQCDARNSVDNLCKYGVCTCKEGYGGLQCAEDLAQTTSRRGIDDDVRIVVALADHQQAYEHILAVLGSLSRTIESFELIQGESLIEIRNQVLAIALDYFLRSNERSLNDEFKLVQSLFVDGVDYRKSLASWLLSLNSNFLSEGLSKRQIREIIRMMRTVDSKLSDFIQFAEFIGNVTQVMDLQVYPEENMIVWMNGSVLHDNIRISCMNGIYCLLPWNHSNLENLFTISGPDSLKCTFEEESLLHRNVYTLKEDEWLPLKQSQLHSSHGQRSSLQTTFSGLATSRRSGESLLTRRNILFSLSTAPLLVCCCLVWITLTCACFACNFSNLILKRKRG